jgi:hypothetical protein
LDKEEYQYRLDNSYRVAQSIMGVSRVLKEQLLRIGAKAWSEMNNNEKVLLLNALRRVYNKEFKK